MEEMMEQHQGNLVRGITEAVKEGAHRTSPCLHNYSELGIMKLTGAGEEREPLLNVGGTNYLNCT